MSGRRQRCLAGAFLLLGVLLPPSVTAVDYSECSIEVGTLDESNLQVNLTCIDEDGSSKLVHNSTEGIPLSEKKVFPGTPITVFAAEGLVVEIAKNNETFTLTNSIFDELPPKLATSKAPLTLRDARVTLKKCTFKGNSHTISGGIHLIGEGKETVIGTTIPTSGPYVEIIDTTFEGGEGKAGGLFIDKFQFVVVNNTHFLPNKKDESSFIEHAGFGTVLLEGTTFEGPEETNAVTKATALYGSGSGTLMFQNCTFTRMAGSAIDWESLKDDRARLLFTDCTFTDCHADEGGAFLVKSPLSLTVNKSKFIGNTAKQGGAFHVLVKDPADRLKLSIGGSEFTGNKADKGGSVLFLKSEGTDPYGYTAEVNMENCNVHDNLDTTPVQMAGGGFVNLTINGGTFKNNQDKFFGGALRMEQMAKVEIFGTHFIDNKVTGNKERTKTPHGGAINCEELEELRIVSSKFVGNKVTSVEADTGGGAIYLTNKESPIRPVKTRVLYIEKTQFDDNAAGLQGGSILVAKADHLSILNCDFVQEQGVTTSGGIIAASESKILDIEKSTFKNGQSRINGGALSLTDCVQVSMIGSTLEKNSVKPASTENGGFLANSDSVGGAIWMKCALDKKCSLNIKKSIFNDNSATTEGGALFVSSVIGCNITDTTFTQKEKVTGNGGAVKIDTMDLQVVGGSFSGGESAMGGALFVESAESIDISGTKFSSNKAEKFGSALYLVPPPATLTASNKPGAAVKVTGATFTRNNADSNAGGCLYLTNLDSFSANRTEFVGNQGGGIVLKSVADGVEIESTKFSEGKSDGSGGALNLDDSKKVTITGSFFHANWALDGGAVQLANVTIVEVEASEFSKNKAKRYGGGAHIANADRATFKDVTFKNNVVDSNEKILAGGGLAMKAVNTVTLTNVTATGNFGAEAHGGGISAYMGTSVIVDDCVISSNTGSTAGGLSVQEFTTDAKISKSKFKSNRAEDAGGAIYVSNTPAVDAEACEFSENKADNDGGAIRINNGTTALKITQAKFIHNVAIKGSGGSISTGSLVEKSPVASATQVDCNQCVFSENRATKDGGAINVYGSTDVTITKSDFVECQAKKGDGGSVNFVGRPPLSTNLASNTFGGDASLNITDADFHDSSAENGDGGTMAISGAGEVVLATANITNSIGQEGGAVKLDDSKAVTMTDVDVANSIGKNNGGAISATNLDSLEITNGVFEGNFAYKKGGALFVVNAPTTIDRATIKDAEARSSGGAMFLSGSDLSMKDSVIEDNEAKVGGGISVSGNTTVELNSVDFVDNTATSWKGSNVYVDSCDAKVLAEGSCKIEVPFKKGFNGMETEEDALGLAFEVAPKCDQLRNETVNVDVCEYEYVIIAGISTFLIVIYILLGLSCIGLLAMFVLVALMKTSMVPARSPPPQPTQEPLIDQTPMV